MTLNDVSTIVGIMGGLAAVGSLYYAWKNDALIRFFPKNPKLIQAFSDNENDPLFISKVHETLQLQVTSRSELIQAFEIAKQMHFAQPMDDALIEVNKRAIELGDLDLAYKVACAAHFAEALDKMLRNTIDGSLMAGNIDLANKCANRMHFAVNKDEGKKRILTHLGIPLK